MSYIIIILLANILIFSANRLFSAAALGYLALNTAVCTLGVIAVDGLAALLVRRALPARWFCPGTALFAVSKRERDLYLKLGIKAWKDHVPELGMFTAFSKSRLDAPDDPAYLARFITENNYGVLCHVAGALLGPLIGLIPYYDGSLSHGRVGIWLPVALVNLILSLAPVLILRYTGYTLERLYRHRVARTARPRKIAAEEHQFSKNG